MPTSYAEPYRPIFRVFRKRSKNGTLPSRQRAEALITLRQRIEAELAAGHYPTISLSGSQISWIAQYLEFLGPTPPYPLRAYGFSDATEFLGASWRNDSYLIDLPIADTGDIPQDQVLLDGVQDLMINALGLEEVTHASAKYGSVSDLLDPLYDKLQMVALVDPILVAPSCPYCQMQLSQVTSSSAVA